MKVVRTVATGLLALVLFASLAALALASPPSGNPAGGCGQGPPDGTVGPPAGQYHGLPSPPSPPSPPGGEYGPPGGQYGGGAGGSGGPPDGCPPPGYEYHP